MGRTLLIWGTLGLAKLFLPKPKLVPYTENIEITILWHLVNGPEFIRDLERILGRDFDLNSWSSPLRLVREVKDLITNKPVGYHVYPQSVDMIVTQDQLRELRKFSGLIILHHHYQMKEPVYYVNGRYLNPIRMGMCKHCGIADDDEMWSEDDDAYYHGCGNCDAAEGQGFTSFQNLSAKERRTFMAKLPNYKDE